MPIPGWKPLLICNNPPSFPVECGFNQLVELAQNVITNLILLSTLLAVVAFIWAGFLLIASQGNSSKKEEAKKVLMNVLKGYLWILVAWLLIYTITSAVLDPKFNNILGSPR